MLKNFQASQSPLKLFFFIYLSSNRKRVDNRITGISNTRIQSSYWRIPTILTP
ncbi:hypothetical protein JHK84_044348 [Glycine max]|uniref:Uncharacterized protein n=1 Tax=Glycine soja TaxID=3848 RepID=A0A445GDK3_GLYSO|nr:hypothetical protein JHK86_044240 [Glycine max]KAG4940200.1 hypothetical protein JHK87_044071 [Glycine soja]KAG5107441.1 hypothetical protein JHK84_044348 [Glycine max]KAH1149702.1 hypothetical protein GYH30_043972 [Glycine max]RZB59337.1 hypothetical protein D0Y65_042541 [Glycine soja]